MRDVVIDIARKAGYPVIEAPIDLPFARLADEIFLTNASNGICAVREFEGRSLGSTITLSVKQRI
jgi:branched-subunit amino acid aminotransferase/4-amino-4-deoxychorismate lyase